MREMNIALILECLRRHSRLSRAELAVMTGLTKATVSSLIKELIDARFVREAGSGTRHKGRPAIPVLLNPEAGFIVGVEVGVDFISALMTDFGPQVVWRHHEAARHSDPNGVLGRVVQVIRLAVAQAEARGGAVLGLGLGVLGQVDAETGTLLYAPNLGWSNVPVRSRLEAEFPFPVLVDNEANLAALGESYFGAARGSEYVLYVSSGVGVGGGIVLNRRILSGATGVAGEVGHMVIDPGGPRCSCGNTGCWETFINQGALYRRIHAAIAAGQTSVLSGASSFSPEPVTVASIVEAARLGDGVAISALETTARYVGLGLANLINAFNPNLVVLGGELRPAIEYGLSIIKDVAASRSLPGSREGVEIVLATHASQGCAMGGIASVYRHVLAQPLAAVRRPGAVGQAQPALSLAPVTAA
jgi:glucokinase-like ROK family protein